MFKFSGCACPICNKSFVPTDDIVVCPDCGAPYHRECYRRQGYCGFEELHKTGKQWKPVQDLPQHNSAGIHCPRCGAENSGEQTVCQSCGWRLDIPYEDSETDAPRKEDFSSHGGSEQFFRQRVNMNSEMADGVTVKELADYVGPNALSFIVKFQDILRSSNPFNFNAAAFLLSVFYCFYRKMYKLGAVILAVLLVTFVPYIYYSVSYLVKVIEVYGIEVLANFEIPTMHGELLDAMMRFATLSRIAMFIIMIFCGLLFNRLYLSSAVKNILKIRNSGAYSTASQQYVYAIHRKGGTNILAPIALFAAYILSIFAAVCFFIL